MNPPRIYVSSLVPESLGRTQNITHDPAPGWGWCLVPQSSGIERSNGFLEVIMKASARKTKVLAGSLMIANLEVNGSSRKYHYLASPFNSKGLVSKCSLNDTMHLKSYLSGILDDTTQTPDLTWVLLSLQEAKKPCWAVAKFSNETLKYTYLVFSTLTKKMSEITMSIDK